MTDTAVLQRAARTAIGAPSICNTHPWRWQTAMDGLRLWADHDRQLVVADPEGRMLTVSCGVTLHHARLALAAAGCATDVQRLPDPEDSDLLAEIHVQGSHEPTALEARLCAAIPRRRTDRRAFSPAPVNENAGAELVAAAEAEGADLHLIHKDQLALRDLAPFGGAPFGGQVRPAGSPTARGAPYAVIFTDDDTPMAWLRAGEALSAVLLTATALGLGTAPMSDVTELAVTREQLRRLVSGVGVPQLAVRIGHAPPGPPPFTLRGSPNEIMA